MNTRLIPIEKSLFVAIEDDFGSRSFPYKQAIDTKYMMKIMLTSGIV